jgi:hypothetical protein
MGRCLILLILLISALGTAPGSSQKGAAAGGEPPPWTGEDCSGTYTFLRSGEFVQINVLRAAATPDEAGPGEEEVERRVSGFVSRLGDTASNRGAVLDHLFTQGSLRGQQLAFATRPVHGVWFAFSGRVERGPATGRRQEGYFVLRGRLTRYVEDEQDATTESSRDVALRSLPAFDDD